MKKILIFIAVLLLLLASILVYLNLSHKSKPTTPQGSVSFPINTQNQDTTINQNSNSDQTISVALVNGTTTTKDFIHNGTTLTDETNPGTYVLAGDLGYCPPEARSCGTGIHDFEIEYDANDQSFTVTLQKEPLSQTRSEAENYLLQVLGVDQNTLCRLNYYVGTTYWVNESYDDRNLGFSFCPGAVNLP